MGKFYTHMKNRISIVFDSADHSYQLEYILDSGKRCGVHLLKSDTTLREVLAVCYMLTNVRVNCEISWIVK